MYRVGILTRILTPGRQMTNHRAVITGLGIVSPIGIGIDSFWTSATKGISGIGPTTLVDTTNLPSECGIAGEVKDFDVRDWMPGQAGRMAGRFSQFAVAASRMARCDAGLVSDAIAPDDVKVAIGSSMNGLTDVHQPNFESFIRGGSIWPWATLEFPAHAATSHVAIANGARGQTTTVATACAAGLDAVGWAADEVSRGRARAVFAGATEAPLSGCTLSALQAVGVLSKWQGAPEQASRPFDRLRQGLVIAEGAAVVVVEDEGHARNRNAHIYSTVLGFASLTEGSHLRKVDETGDTGARAMASALRAARLQPSDIDYIAAHGNSMPDYDVAETRSIKRVFGRHAWNIPISSLKSMCGQALAASSAMQVVAACLTLQHQMVLPTINYDEPDPDCDLDYVANHVRSARVRTVLVHSHSLGGSHSVLILGAPR
jgi:3-oxoacyl-[acyl-carrier-protein] synthase II